jgi:TorA maturation chaperone TorD
MTPALRRDVYRVLGGLLIDCPSEALCAALVRDRSLDRLGTAVGDRLGLELGRLHRALEADPHDAIQRDFIRLFVGPRKKLAPPWESVYRDPSRLVLQDAADGVLRAYAEERLGFDGMGKQPPDHIALELQFCAALVDRAESRASSADALRRFLDEHLLVWAPRFAADLVRIADTEVVRAIGGALLALCDLEANAAARAAGHATSGTTAGAA